MQLLSDPAFKVAVQAERGRTRGILESYDPYRLAARFPAGSDVQYAGLDKGDAVLSSATVADLSRVSLATGDLALGSDNSLVVKHNSISSGDIKDKTIKNVDIASSAINSRTIKNGSIAAKDLNTDGGSGFLQNDGGDLSWSPISVSLSNLPIPAVGNPTVMDDLGEAFDYMWSAGVISGGDITDNGGAFIQFVWQQRHHGQRQRFGECCVRRSDAPHCRFADGAAQEYGFPKPEQYRDGQ